MEKCWLILDFLFYKKKYRLYKIGSFYLGEVMYYKYYIWVVIVFRVVMVVVD